MQKKFSPLSFAGGMLLILFACGLGYVLIPKQKNNQSSLELDKARQTEDSCVFSRDHFYRTQHHKHLSKDAEVLVLMPEEESMLEKGNLNAQERKLVELLPNAPSVYLYDLKVTEFQKLYFENSTRALHDTVASKLLNLAMKSLRDNKFETALEKFKPLLRINNDDPNALFYSGISCYYIKDYPKALIMFNRIGNLSNNVFKQDAYWYKALCFLDMKKNAEAKTLLQHIADIEGFYSGRAKKALIELK